MKAFAVKCFLILVVMFSAVIIVNAQEDGVVCTSSAVGNNNTEVICHGPVGEWKSTKWCKGAGQNGIWSNCPSGCEPEGQPFTICDRCGTTQE